MNKAIEAMDNDFHAIRTGRASPALVEKLQVEYYGSHVALQTLATISVPEPQMLLIKPFDPGTIRIIEKAISASDLKLTPNTDGKVVRLVLPPLTLERRREIARHVHKRLEEAKVQIRNQRRDAMEMLKEYEEGDLISEDDHKRGKQEIENLTHKMTAHADEVAARKEKEITEL
ncbi:MAG: ribosome recycling factor [Thermoflexales bacterium]|nr:ribosome recycling factor [Thermoflexales bacterium]